MQIESFVSPWDGRRWRVRGHITCTTPSVVYVVTCDDHPDYMYVGSTTNLRRRWANHKSDIKHNKVTKCSLTRHVCEGEHPMGRDPSVLKIFSIEHVPREERLLERELYWQANLGTLACGWNERRDFNSVLRYRVQYGKV